MTATLTLFEHESKPFCWTDRDLVIFERLRGTLNVDVLRPTIRNAKREIQAAQYVGVVRLGHRTVQILPKMYRANEAVPEQQRAQEATRNLLHLLAYAGQLPIREHEIAPLVRRDSDWFEILTRLFASHLMEEWQRGASRNYQTVEAELPVLKGTWRITEQLRRPERKHLFAVAYDEFTADNPINRVFRYVVERLWHLTRDANNRRLLGDLRQWMDEVALLPSVTAADASPTLLTRLNQRYAPLLNLARLFLDGGALQLAADDLTTFAFVFDMNQLFEAFIANFIRRHRDEILPPALQRCDMLVQSRGATCFLAHTNGKPVFQLRPDIAFRDSTEFPLLIDTKYKRLNAADTTLGVSQDDFYQMHAYAHRYHCPRVLLLYPQTAGMAAPLQTHFGLVSHDTVISVATIDVRVDLQNAADRYMLIERLRSLFHKEQEDG
ncbi:MAG: McrC family protein [Thermomicrobiales bacterium]